MNSQAHQGPFRKKSVSFLVFLWSVLVFMPAASAQSAEDAFLGSLYPSGLDGVLELFRSPVVQMILLAGIIVVALMWTFLFGSSIREALAGKVSSKREASSKGSSSRRRAPDLSGSSRGGFPVFGHSPFNQLQPIDHRKKER